MRESNYSQYDLIMIAYSVADENSFKNINNSWLSEIKSNSSLVRKINSILLPFQKLFFAETLLHFGLEERFAARYQLSQHSGLAQQRFHRGDTGRAIRQ